MDTPTSKWGFTKSGRAFFKVNSGFEVVCLECGKRITALDGFFTRGDKSKPICRKCRPFEVDERESRKLWPSV
jgi:hypothetical protein